MSDRSYFSRQIVLSPDSGLGQIPSRVVVNPNGASLNTVQQTLSDYDADIVYMYTRFRNETMRSGLGYVKRYYRHPLFEMIYRFNNGQERIDMIMTPVPGGGVRRSVTDDINLDGYLGASLAFGGGSGRVETIQYNTGGLGQMDYPSIIYLLDTWWVYTSDNSIVPYVFHGSEAAVSAEANKYPTGQWTEAYRVQQFWRVLAWARVNMDEVEEAQVWAATHGNPTSDPEVYTVYVLKGTLTQLTEDEIAPLIGLPGSILPPGLPLPDGFGGRPGSPFADRVTPQSPTTVNIKVRDGNDKRTMAEFDLTVSQGMVRATSVLKIGPTALRARNEYTDPALSRGAEVEIAPPPPKPFSDLPDYYGFQHSDDPSTYILEPDINLVGELPSDQMPAGGFFEIEVTGTPPDVGYVSLGMSGEFFAQNIIREVTSSWTKTAGPGEVIRTNDFPVQPELPGVLFFGTSYEYGIANYVLQPGQDEQYPSKYIVSFRLDEVVLPPLDDPDFTIWGYVDLNMTVTPQ